ncbi:MAG: hypothetical protein HQL65_04820 [Magnetococcales bacterium]|nr:hypothetical protein [Magnetococcales bacterium]
MSAMQDEIEKIINKINALTKRERVILIGIFVAVIGALWDTLYLEPWIKNRAEIQKKIVATRSQIDTLNKTEAMVLGRSKEDPDRESRERKKKYLDEITKIKAELASAMRDMVDPRDMPDILGHFFKSESGLQLITMAAEPAVPVVTKAGTDKNSANKSSNKSSGNTSDNKNSANKSSNKSSTNTSDKTDKASDDKSNDKSDKKSEDANSEASDDFADESIFKHGMQIRLRGNYLDVVRYLKSLEGMKWVIFWDSLEYAVGQYPDMTVTLSVYSLSLSREWIGL